MRLRRPRLAPVMLVMIFLVLLAGATSAEQLLQHRRSQLLAARTAYLLAVSETKTQLEGLMAKVTSDSALVQNLNWKLPHSVRGALEGKLQKGALDQISLVTRGCNELSRASFAHLIQVTCPFALTSGHGGDKSGDKLGDFYWSLSDGAPVLALARPLSGDAGETVAVGAALLDEQWVGLHEGLARLIDKLGLRIAEDGGVPLVEADAQSGIADLATLRSNHAVDRYLLGQINNDMFMATSVAWPALILALVFGLLALARERASRLTADKALSELIAWCRGLAPSNPLVVQQPAEGGPPVSGLDLAKKLVNHAFALKSEALSTQTQKRQALEGQLRSKEEDLQKFRIRLAELAELDSLAVQLQHTTASFLKRMDGFHHQVDDLTNGTLQGLGERSRDLHKLLGTWSSGVAERGSRKFIRSLAESPGTKNPETTQLDEELADVQVLSTSISDLALSSTQLGKKLLETASFAARIAGLWHGLALKTHDAPGSDGLIEPMEEAQALVHLEPAYGAAQFSNPADSPSLRALLPHLPKPVWVSALYHVYLAMAELMQDSPATVATRLRQDGDKTLLIIKVGATDATQLPKRSERQAYHLEISRAILAPFRIALSVLPALDGPYPVVLSWSGSEQAKSVALAQDAKATKEKGASQRGAPSI